MLPGFGPVLFLQVQIASVPVVLGHFKLVVGLGIHLQGLPVMFVGNGPVSFLQAQVPQIPVVVHQPAVISLFLVEAHRFLDELFSFIEFTAHHQHGDPGVVQFPQP